MGKTNIDQKDQWSVYVVKKRKKFAAEFYWRIILIITRKMEKSRDKEGIL
jgi:hypothetical protein